jgi:heat induced stress protein YflT
MAENNAVAGVYNRHAEAQATIKELQSLGFDMNKLSIVGKDYHTEERIIGDVNAGYRIGYRMKAWRQFGDFWGGLSALLLGSAFYFFRASVPS